MLGTHGHWAVRVFFSLSHLLWHPFIMSSSMIRDTHTYYRAFSSGAVTTCFYDLGLSWLGIEHPTLRLRDQRSNRLRHRRGIYKIMLLYAIVWYAMLWDLSKRSFFHRRVPFILHSQVKFLYNSTRVIVLHVNRVCYF